MNKEQINKLKELISDFEGQDILIEIKEAIQFHTLIHNSKIIVSDEKLIISDEKEQDFIIDLFYLDDVKMIENTIYLEMSNDLQIQLDN